MEEILRGKRKEVCLEEEEDDFQEMVQMWFGSGVGPVRLMVM